MIKHDTDLQYGYTVFSARTHINTEYLITTFADPCSRDAKVRKDICLFFYLRLSHVPEHVSESGVFFAWASAHARVGRVNIPCRLTVPFHLAYSRQGLCGYHLL